MLRASLPKFLYSLELIPTQKLADPFLVSNIANYATFLPEKCLKHHVGTKKKDLLTSEQVPLVCKSDNYSSTAA